MRPLRSAFVALALATSLVVPAGSQVGPPAGAVPADADASGTASLAGVVVAEPSGEPVPGARVTISAGALQRVTTTDGRGRFSFSSLPATAFHVHASRPGYLDGAYGAAAPHAPGTLLRLRDREARDIGIRLSRGGVITGTVVDDRHLPVVGVRMVSARRDGTSEPHPAGFTITDDRGAFRIHSLVPGQYVLCTVAQSFGAPGTRESLRAQLDALDVPSQAWRPPVPTPEAAVSRRTWLAEQLRILKPDIGFAPTCLPAPGSGDDTIAVASGQERIVDFQLHRVPLASVEVIVGGYDGSAGDLRASLHPEDALLPETNVMFAAPSVTGRLRFRDVSPGRYRLAVRTGREAAVHHTDGGAPAGLRRLPSRYALADVEVNGEDIDGLVVELREGIEISGRIVFDGTRQAPDMGSVTVRVQPSPAGRGSRSPVVDELDTTADAAGRFTIAGVVPGDYTVTGYVQGASGWHLDSAALDDRDLLDDSLGVTGARDIDGVVLTFTDRITEVTGTAMRAGGAPATGYVLLLYAEEEALRMRGRRRPRIIFLMPDGRFTSGAVPPGEYRLAAVHANTPGDHTDPELLRRLDATAMRISLARGEQRVVRVTVP